jgi:hypothetical protein
MPLPETRARRDRVGLGYSLQSQTTLIDLLDRLIDCGVTAAGNVRLGLAGIDLIALDLRLLLSSVETLERQVRTTPVSTGRAAAKTPREAAPARRPRPGPAADAAGTISADPVPRDLRASGLSGEELDRGLGRLIFAILEVVHQLMERQALRRVEGGSLSPDEVERLGRALAALELRMAELRERFSTPSTTVKDTLLQVDNLLVPEQSHSRFPEQSHSRR